MAVQHRIIESEMESMISRITIQKIFGALDSQRELKFVGCSGASDNYISMITVSSGLPVGASRLSSATPGMMM
jgi:hypothetical protein